MTWAEHFSVWNEPGGIIEMPRGQEHEYMMAYSQFLAQQRKPPEQVGNPWRSWECEQPPRDKWIMAWRSEWDVTKTFHASSVHEAMNIANLYWRLA